MKLGNYILTVIFFILCSFALNGQDKTIDSLQRALQTQQEDTNKVKTLIQLGSKLTVSSEYNNAIKYLNQAMALSTKLNFKIGQAQSYELTAWIYQRQGYYTEAKSNYISGITIYKEVGSKSKEAYLISRLANSYYTEGDITEAIKTSYEALKIYEELKDKTGVAYTYILIGGFYYVDKNYSESLKNFYSSLKIYEEAKDTFGITYSNLEIGRVHVQQGNYTEAQKKFIEVLKVFEEGKEEAWIAETHISMGELFENMGDKNKINSQNNYLEALRNYSQNLLYYEKIKDRGALTTVYYLVGNIHLKLGDFQVAKTNLEKALQLGKEIGSKGDLRDIYKSLSRLDSSQSNYQQAFEHYKMHILYQDSISNEETKKKLVRTTMQYEFDKKEAVTKLAQERKRIGQWRVIASLGLLILVFLLIMFFQWRNSKHRKKANVLLQQQKEKVETTLFELRSAQSQLIQSEKMASLGELTAGIAHEIQNPLNFVNNFSEVNDELLKELTSEAEKGNLEEVKAIASDIAFNSEKINHHGKRADSIVKGMLQHSRTSSGQKEPTDINALTDEYLRLAYHGLRAKDKSFNATTKTEFDNSIGKVNVVSQDLGRVILNLINNAFYTVSEKAKHNITGYEPTVTVSTKKEKNKVEIKVKDNGNGIPQKILDKIFQPFFTTKPTGQGTGLGLSLAYDIVTKGHGGELKVETKEGEGSEFVIQLQSH